MNKLLLITLLSFLSFGGYAQAEFEAGYFINNNGKKTDCFIRNTGEIINPKQFEYRLSEKSAIKVATIDSVKEFEILNSIYKYQKHSVELGDFSNDLKAITNNKEITFRKEELFLRVVVAGEGSLYAYRNRGGEEKFFYSTNGSGIEQLVFKIYLTDENKITENNTFKQQLWNNLKCKSLSEVYFRNIKYTESSLVKLFVRYNECTRSEYTNYSKRKPKGTYSYTIKAGLNTSYVKLEQSITTRQPQGGGSESYSFQSYTTHLDKKILPVIGLEIEYILPSDKKRWSLLLEPTYYYHQYKTKGIVYSSTPSPSNPGSAGGGLRELSVNYSHIALPAGFRYSYYFNERSRLYINGALAYNIVISPAKVLTTGNSDTNPYFNQDRLYFVPSFNAGLGYKHKNTFSLEIGYQLGKTMLDSNKWKVSFSNSMSLTFGYHIF
jgi:hypothetical protein